ncbi:MAG TPA: flippase-like domain-containing protein, partial [Humisphaera sp.]|nr:flippase-like domain-containing protein [Humisphaera sp.]
MKAPGKLQIAIIILGLAGAALFIELLRSHGVSDVLAAVAAVGWGLAAVVAFHLIPLFVDGMAWGALFPPNQRPRVLQLFWMRWMGEAVSTLLPATQVGGDIVRARLAAIYGGVGIPVAAATVLIDITLSIFTQIIFTVTGLALLVGVSGHAIPAHLVLVGAAVAFLAIAAFYVVQRMGLFRLIGLIASKLAGSDEWESLVKRGDEFDRVVITLYSRNRGILASACWTMSSWLFGACEVWIALHALGLPAHFTQALILESVGQGIRAAMFLVPGALGVQELGYLEVGRMLGIPDHAALTLALVRR